jgi:hypothetical protein
MSERSDFFGPLMSSDVLELSGDDDLSVNSAKAVERAFLSLDQYEWNPQSLLKDLSSLLPGALETVERYRAEAANVDDRSFSDIFDLSRAVNEYIEAMSLLIAYEITKVLQERFKGDVDEAKKHFRDLLTEAVDVVDPAMKERILQQDVTVVLSYLRTNFQKKHPDLDLSTLEVEQLFIYLEGCLLTSPDAVKLMRHGIIESGRGEELCITGIDLGAFRDHLSGRGSGFRRLFLF